MINTIIKGVGMYLPEKVLTNDDISEFVDTSHEWIFDRTGIRQRHIASKDQMTSDLAYMSALDAIQDANINATDIDLIILATSTPDQVFPSTAVKLQDMLNIRDGAAFDIHAVCSGFIYALSTADNFIKSGKYKRILVIGSEVYSRILNWKDRTTCVLFGDASGAFVLEGQNNDDIRSGIIDSLIRSDGQYQANLRILQTTAKKLKSKEEKIIVTVDKHANTSSASIPVAMTTAIKENKIKRGDMCLLEAFGAGFTWGAVLLRY